MSAPSPEKLLFVESSPLATTIMHETISHGRRVLYEIETETNKTQKITYVRKLDLSTSDHALAQMGEVTDPTHFFRSRGRECAPHKRRDREDPLEPDRRR